MRQSVQFGSSSDISLDVLNIAVVWLLHAVVECVSFYFRVFTTSQSFCYSSIAYSANAALVLSIRLVQELQYSPASKCWRGKLVQALVQLAELFSISSVPVIPVLTLCCLESLFNKIQLKSRLFVLVLAWPLLVELPQHLQT